MKCPFDRGTLLPWNKPPRHYPWFCPNNDVHGGNGQFFSQEDVEEDLTLVEQLISEYIKAIIDGDMSSEDAVKIIARRTKKPEAMVRARIAIALKLSKNYVSIKKATVPISAPKADTVAHGSPSRGSGGKIAPDQFMAVMKEHELTKKQAAEAIGRSVSRVHELTVTKGGSETLLELFKQKLSEYNPN